MRPVILTALLGTSLVALLTLDSPRAAADDDKRVDFLRDVRPVLSNACFHCHGPDDQNRKKKLRLDTREGAFGDRGGFAAFVPGKPEESDGFQRMKSHRLGVQMPPVKSGKTVTPEQVELVRKWIEQGAKWEEHWAFVAPKKPAVPTVKESAWVRNPIDAFILQKLEKKGVKHGPEADKITLLRRLSLDLTGLPPTIAEVDAFLADQKPGAYERQVDRLLASPHYGERWGRLWLDAARYADSDGYENDKRRQVWAYRDWVIQAINRDLPYDRFIIEQIAGDLLPNAGPEQQAATGFLRNSMTNDEGGIDPEQFRMEAMFDRMDALGKSVLGLTVQCSQCHTHKFDPLTQTEYYRMMAFLNNCEESSMPVYTPQAYARRGRILADIRKLEKSLQEGNADWQDRMARWEAEVTKNQPVWQVLDLHADETSAMGQKFRKLSDGSLLAGGYTPSNLRLHLKGRAPVKGITAIRLELLCHPSLPLHGPGRSVQGVCALTQFAVDAAPPDHTEKKTRLKIAGATADVAMPETPLPALLDERAKKPRVLGPISYAIDGKKETAWGIDIGPGRRNQPRKAVFNLATPLTTDAVLTIHLDQDHGGWTSSDNQSNNLGRIRLSVTTAPKAVADPLPADVRRILAIPREQRTSTQVDLVFSYWRTAVAEWSATNQKIEALWKQYPENATQLVLRERTTMRPTHLLERGDFLKPAQVLEPGVPAFLHPFPAGAPRNRLGFARWLVDRRSPTAARTAVNRTWQALFGIGLVRTAEDLGSQGDPPWHRNLLDWLAVEFMDQGWSNKKLQRLILTSATYRQSSRVSPDLVKRDPDNRLLARGPRFRVDAEIVRDIAMSASGLLSLKIGGPSVCPTAPAFLFQPPTSYNEKLWPLATGAARYRRAMYTFAYRSTPYPALQTFDAPNGDCSCVRRARSNTPLQALTTLNEPVFMECARALGLRTLREGGLSDSDRLTYAFRCCLSRKPSEKETKVLLSLLDRQTKHYTAKEADAWKMAGLDPNKLPKLPAGTTGPQAAAWTVVARVLLNLDETITKE